MINACLELIQISICEAIRTLSKVAKVQPQVLKKFGVIICHPKAVLEAREYQDSLLGQCRKARLILDEAEPSLCYGKGPYI